MKLTTKQITNFISILENANQHILPYNELIHLIQTKGDFPKSISETKIIKILIQQTKLNEITLEFPNRKVNKKVRRYSFGNFSIYELAQSLYQNSYLSHYSALYLHQLTTQIPKTIYVNLGQKRLVDDRNKINQELLNQYAKRKRKLSTDQTTYGDFTITIIRTLSLENDGIITIKDFNGVDIRVTDLERTLIDIAVRTEYAGGVYEVLNAYRTAVSKGLLSTNRLIQYLKQYNFAYPYHQCIGFYLSQTSNYSADLLNLIRKFRKIEFDFYLVPGLPEYDYNSEWRLFIPKRMNVLE